MPVEASDTKMLWERDSSLALGLVSFVTEDSPQKGSTILSLREKRVMFSSRPSLAVIDSAVSRLVKSPVLFETFGNDGVRATKRNPS